jgi:RNA polymerase sigma factor (sigma-70 family)
MATPWQPSHGGGRVSLPAARSFSAMRAGASGALWTSLAIAGLSATPGRDGVRADTIACTPDGVATTLLAVADPTADAPPARPQRVEQAASGVGDAPDGAGLAAVSEGAPFAAAAARAPRAGAPKTLASSGVDLEQERSEVERAQAGDRAALAVILRRYGPMLFRSVLLPRLGSQVAAEEALSQTYAKVIEKLDRFTWQSVGVYPWLRVVAMRVALDNLRARRREIPFDTDDLAREVDRAEHDFAGVSTDAATIARQDAASARERVEGALAKIHPRYARAIRMRILEERSREDVALELGVTTATFDVVMHRAMAAMRKALSPAQGEEET